MSEQTLAAVGVTLPDGAPGFVLVSNHAPATLADPGHSEDLQDHTCRFGS